MAAAPSRKNPPTMLSHDSFRNLDRSTGSNMAECMAETMLDGAPAQSCQVLIQETKQEGTQAAWLGGRRLRTPAIPTPSRCRAAPPGRPCRRRGRRGREVLLD